MNNGNPVLTATEPWEGGNALRSGTCIKNGLPALRKSGLFGDLCASKFDSARLE